MPDFLEEKRKEISQRLKELRPLVDEYQRLEAAEKALSGVDGNRRSAAPAPSTPRRARSARAKGSGTRRRGRPRGSGTRANPGARAREVTPRRHHPRARRGDGHQAELSVPRDARARRGGQGHQVGAWVALQRVTSHGRHRLVRPSRGPDLRAMTGGRKPYPEPSLK